ncbi:hypothetical protein [Paenibacillus macerans]|uniref:hypothetical protein n=1 Tax=Paenibacillus macerans TaxID=44252 RepID=UPI003D31B4D4
MKLKTLGSSKKIAGTILASALVLGSLGTISAFTASFGDAVPKNAVMTAPGIADVSNTIGTAQGMVEYSKNEYARTDGSQNVTMEYWYNPETKDYRMDSREYSADHKLLSYRSTYRLEGGAELVYIQRDANGNPLRGKIVKKTDDPEGFARIKFPATEFEARKEYYRDGSWTSIGTEQTADGKTLNKIMQSYQSYIDDDTQVNAQLIAFLDPETGLPVKDELYEDSTGTPKLFSSSASAFAEIADTGSVFGTDGLTLTQVQTVAAAAAAFEK